MPGSTPTPPRPGAPGAPRRARRRGRLAPEGVGPLPGIEPLVLWEDNPANATDTLKPRIEVDHALVRLLRPHQREGVRLCSNAWRACGFRRRRVHHDDMAKLQGITLLWTLLEQGTQGKPTVSRADRVPHLAGQQLGRRVRSGSTVGSRRCPCAKARAGVVSSVARFLGPRTPRR